MVTDAAILYPSIVLALMTMLLIFALGIRRFFAVRNRVVNGKYYQTFSEGGGEPEGLRRHSRNVQNLFEVPPLFHLAALGIYVAGEVDIAALVAAWFFVATRALHSFIHIAYNNVLHRFFVYGLGVMAVGFLWIKLLLSLIA
jgi:hypothetical protein